MKTMVALFCSSALFGLSISGIYWFSSHDRGGSLLLGFMCIALSWAAGYAFLAERAADLAGDDPEPRPGERAGEEVMLITKESPWPICLALSILWLTIGLIWSNFMIVTGVLAMLACLWRLAAESARVGSARVLDKEGREQEFT
jgi:Cytochrome c oxidase subunit IV